jgi:hypothetical protein
MSGMIVVPASLRSDFIHMAGMTIHIALESTIHIAGIRTVPFVPVSRFDAPQVHRRTVQVIPLFAVISLFKPLGTCHTRLSPA